MEETHEQQKLHGFLRCGIYLSVLLEAAVFVYIDAPFWGVFALPLHRLAVLAIYHKLIYSKLATMFLICLVSIGTLAKKKENSIRKSTLFTRWRLACCFFWLYGLYGAGFSAFAALYHRV
ncbi:hypothetical protein ACRQ5D_34055 [Mucilaginibacter sp. P25]|uniref:hypothetical protein n=1 Tax=Mucilaginibacter sp. P25 TaxID=3423945 RepID=UPI003D7B1D8E